MYLITYNTPSYSINHKMPETFTGKYNIRFGNLPPLGSPAAKAQAVQTVSDMISPPNYRTVFGFPASSNGNSNCTGGNCSRPGSGSGNGNYGQGTCQRSSMGSSPK